MTPDRRRMSSKSLTARSRRRVAHRHPPFPPLRRAGKVRTVKGLRKRSFSWPWSVWRMRQSCNVSIVQPDSRPVSSGEVTFSWQRSHDFCRSSDMKLTPALHPIQLFRCRRSGSIEQPQNATERIAATAHPIRRAHGLESHQRFHLDAWLHASAEK